MVNGSMKPPVALVEKYPYDGTLWSASITFQATLPSDSNRSHLQLWSNLEDRKLDLQELLVEPRQYWLISIGQEIRLLKLQPYPMTVCLYFIKVLQD